MNLLDNFIKGPLTSIVGLLFLAASGYGWYTEWLTDWQGVGGGIAGFVLLRMKDELPVFIGSFFKGLIAKYTGKKDDTTPPSVPPTGLILLPFLFFYFLASGQAQSDASLKTQNQNEIRKGKYSADNASDFNDDMIDSKANLDLNLLSDRGSYNASVNVFPSSGGSGPSGAIKRGNVWTISVAGTLGGTAVVAGQTIRALVNAPGQTLANWNISASGGGGGGGSALYFKNGTHKAADSTTVKLGGELQEFTLIDPHGNGFAVEDYNGGLGTSFLDFFVSETPANKRNTGVYLQSDVMQLNSTGSAIEVYTGSAFGGGGLKKRLTFDSLGNANFPNTKSFYVKGNTASNTDFLIGDYGSGYSEVYSDTSGISLQAVNINSAYGSLLTVSTTAAGLNSSGEINISSNTNSTLQAGGNLDLRSNTGHTSLSNETLSINISTGGFDGTPGQVLTSDGTNVSWETPSGGGGSSLYFKNGTHKKADSTTVVFGGDVTEPTTLSGDYYLDAYLSGFEWNGIDIPTNLGGGVYAYKDGTAKIQTFGGYSPGPVNRSEVWLKPDKSINLYNKGILRQQIDSLGNVNFDNSPNAVFSVGNQNYPYKSVYLFAGSPTYSSFSGISMDSTKFDFVRYDNGQRTLQYIIDHNGYYITSMNQDGNNSAASLGLVGDDGNILLDSDKFNTNTSGNLSIEGGNIEFRNGTFPTASIIRFGIDTVGNTTFPANKLFKIESDAANPSIFNRFVQDVGTTGMIINSDFVTSEIIHDSTQVSMDNSNPRFGNVNFTLNGIKDGITVQTSGYYVGSLVDRLRIDSLGNFSLPNTNTLSLNIASSTGTADQVLTSGGTFATWQNPTGKQLVGTATNDAASAGNVGERRRSNVSTYTNFTTSATYQQLATVNLTAGDWEISASFTYSSNTATLTAASDAIFAISTTTASSSGVIEGESIAYIAQASLLGTSHQTNNIGPYRVSLSGSTNYYLNGQATFTLGNPQYVATLKAVRVR